MGLYKKMNSLINSPETESALNIMELNAFSNNPVQGISSEMNFAARLENVEKNFEKVLAM